MFHATPKTSLEILNSSYPEYIISFRALHTFTRSQNRIKYDLVVSRVTSDLNQAKHPCFTLFNFYFLLV